MKIFLFLLLLAAPLLAQEPKKIVVGGNENATLGQAIAGYKTTFNVGIRTPEVSTTKVDEDTPLFPFVGSVYPNPCDRITQFTGETPKSIRVFTLIGVEVENSVDMGTGTITLPSAGTYLVKVISSNTSTRTFTVISK